MRKGCVLEAQRQNNVMHVKTISFQHCQSIQLKRAKRHKMVVERRAGQIDRGEPPVP